MQTTRHHRRSGPSASSLLAVFTIWTLIPILLLLMQSVKPEGVMFADPPQFFFQPTGVHLPRFFTRNNIMDNMINSIIVAVSTMLLCVVLGSICAYSLARIRVVGSKFIAFSLF